MTVSTKQQLAARILADFADNNAGAITEELLRDFLTDVIDSALLPGVSVAEKAAARAALGLPTGTAAATGIKWSETSQRWEALSTETTIYYAITRAAAYASIAEAILHALNTEGNRYPPPNDRVTAFEPWTTREGYAYNVLGESERDIAITNVWTDGGAAPYAWVLSPASEDWIDNFTIVYRANGVAVAQPAITVERDFMRINGTPYDAGYLQLAGDRPNATGSPGSSVVPTYNKPAEAAATVEQGV